MQIFVRFAYGKVITIDIAKRTTKIALLIQLINIKIRTTQVEYSLSYKAGDKEIILYYPPNVKDELVCKDDRIVNNQVIELTEISIYRKFKEVNVSYYDPADIKTQKIDGITPFSTVMEVKTKIKEITQFEVQKQKVFYGNTELDDDNKPLNAYNIDVYEILQYLYKGTPKEAELEKMYNIPLFCYQRQIDIIYVKINGSDAVINSNMRILGVKKYAKEQLKICKEVENDKLETKLEIKIDGNVIAENVKTVKELTAEGKLKQNSVILITPK